MFNLYLGLTMAFYALFPNSGRTVNQYFTIPYVKRHIMTPYIAQIEIRLAIIFLVKFLFFLLLSHFVVRFSKIDRLFNKGAPVSLIIILSSVMIAFVDIYYRIHSTNDLRSFVISISQIIIIFSLIRMYVLNNEYQGSKNI
jgi:hypothetical protein